MPQITNYVDLDPDVVDVYGLAVPRVTYKNHPYEVAAAEFYTPLMVEIMESIGGPTSAYPTVTPLAVLALDTVVPAVLPGSLDNVGEQIVYGRLPFSQISASAHIMGTHRMANDPAHGPCDPYGRYWGFDNLYHAGGGLQPTSPGFNVTLTFWALSYWVGSAIVAGVGNKHAYTHRDIAGAMPKLLKVLTTLDPDTMIARVLKK